MSRSTVCAVRSMLSGRSARGDFFFLTIAQGRRLRVFVVDRPARGFWVAWPFCEWAFLGSVPGTVVTFVFSFICEFFLVCFCICLYLVVNSFF